MNFLTTMFGAVKEFFGWARERNAVKNSPAVIAAEVAQQEVNAKAKTAAAIKNHDTLQIQKELAE